MGCVLHPVDRFARDDGFGGPTLRRLAGPTLCGYRLARHKQQRARARLEQMVGRFAEQHRIARSNGYAEDDERRARPRRFGENRLRQLPE